jgi:hypothetical protein
METALLFIILTNTVVLIISGAVTIVSVRHISTSVRDIARELRLAQETATRGEQMTARVLTMLAGIEEEDQ